MSAIATELTGAAVVDLFAGSGALGIEALSRGARHATFVESAPRAVQVLRDNLADLRAEPSSFDVVRTDAMRFVDRLRGRAFDVALADPPYGEGLATGLAERFAAVPFARLLCIEHSSDEPIPGEPAWQRRYGDTVLTFLRSDDD